MCSSPARGAYLSRPPGGMQALGKTRAPRLKCQVCTSLCTRRPHPLDPWWGCEAGFAPLGPPVGGPARLNPPHPMGNPLGIRLAPNCWHEG
ncbi:uncharacterized protein STAUR_5240 [Stigmatella aurantiaca DW4/3-1]|uniref:Uncharacterized protein n=1 Tax=Stigmatella aurantiaca (strain DW4/3-1) TaxID=378806 RepID=E3FLB9_STIAD|nr:uncharacterized protein STAUR_5240 [Stigmatella aurantiaca DW4/3-1]